MKEKKTPTEFKSGKFFLEEDYPFGWHICCYVNGQKYNVQQHECILDAVEWCNILNS